MKFGKPILEGTLLKRYKRFLADVRLETGEEITVHCANPGAMTGLAEPESRVILSDSENPKRKLRYTLELVHVGDTWVGVNTAFTNHVAREALEAGRVPALAGQDELRSEVLHGEKSRLDFCLKHGETSCFVEVKSVTLEGGGAARFPDSRTARGLKHLAELEAAIDQGHRAAMLYVVGREDCAHFEPARDIDPDYAEGLRRAADHGVEVLAHGTRVEPTGITLGDPLPVRLDA